MPVTSSPIPFYSLFCQTEFSASPYGEAVRRALTDGGFEVHRISGKSTSDYKEIFDGVPRQHTAAIIKTTATTSTIKISLHQRS